MYFVNLCLQHLISEIRCSPTSSASGMFYAHIIHSFFRQELDIDDVCDELGISATPTNLRTFTDMQNIIFNAYRLMNDNEMKPETKEKTEAAITRLGCKFLNSIDEDDCEEHIALSECSFERDMKPIIEFIQRDIIDYLTRDDVNNTFSAIQKLNFDVLKRDADAINNVKEEVNTLVVLLREKKDIIGDQQALKEKLSHLAVNTLRDLTRVFVYAKRIPIMQKFQKLLTEIKSEVYALVQGMSKASNCGDVQENVAKIDLNK